MHKLYLFNNTQAGRHFDTCYSMTDKGVVLGSHICSDSGYMQLDLHDRPDRLETILKHFNNEPYELVIVPDNEVKTHSGLCEAFRLNQIAGDKEKQEETNNG